MSVLRRLRARMRPTTIAGQIALLVVAGIAVAHMVATAAFLLLHESQNPDTMPGVAASRLGMLTRLLDAVDPAGRPALLASGRSLPLIHVEAWDGAVPPGAEPVPDLPVIRRLRNGAGRPVRIIDLSAGDTDTERSDRRLHVGIVTAGGAMLQATLPNDPLRAPKQGALIFTVVFLALTLALLCVWATRALTAPLKRLAGAARPSGPGTITWPCRRRARARCSPSPGARPEQAGRQGGEEVRQAPRRGQSHHSVARSPRGGTAGRSRCRHRPPPPPLAGRRPPRLRRAAASGRRGRAGPGRIRPAPPRPGSAPRRSRRSAGQCGARRCARRVGGSITAAEARRVRRPRGTCRKAATISSGPSRPKPIAAAMSAGSLPGRLSSRATARRRASGQRATTQRQRGGPHPAGPGVPGQDRARTEAGAGTDLADRQVGLAQEPRHRRAPLGRVGIAQPHRRLSAHLSTVHQG